MNTSDRKNKNLAMASRFDENQRDVVFGHFRICFNENRFSRFNRRYYDSVGYVTVALLRPPKGSSSHTYTAALSFCAPSDTPNRKLARKIAVGRLFCKRQERCFSFEFRSPKHAEVLLKAAHLATDSKLTVNKHANTKRQVTTEYAPLWLRRAIQEGRDFEQL